MDRDHGDRHRDRGRRRATTRARSRPWIPRWPPTRSPSVKMLRDDMPVMPIDDMPSGPGGAAVAQGGDHGGPAPPRDLLLQHGRGRPQEQAADDPAADRPAGPQEVPQAARPDLRPPQDGSRWTTRCRRSSTDLIDGFIDRGEVDFAKEFSVPFPSQVFLTLLGLPLEELDTLPHHEGRHHPPRPRDRQALRVEGGQRLPAEDRRLGLRLLQRGPRPARDGTRRTTCSRIFLDAEVEGDRLTREDILDICFLFLIAGLDTVTATLDCMFAFLAQHPEHRRQLVEDPSPHPERHRGAAALGDAGHGHRPRRRGGHRARRLPGPRRATR